MWAENKAVPKLRAVNGWKAVAGLIRSTGLNCAQRSEGHTVARSLPTSIFPASILGTRWCPALPTALELGTATAARLQAGLRGKRRTLPQT